MKYFYVTVLVFCFAIDSFAQKIAAKDVPQAVIDSYSFAYPNSKPKKWELINQQYCSYTKTSNGNEIAKFFSNGEWIETIISISEEELPLACFEFKKKKFDGYVLEDISFIERNNAKPIYIVVYALKNNRAFKTEVVFDLKGRALMIDGLEIVESETDSFAELEAGTVVVEIEKVAPEVLEVNPLVTKAFNKKFPKSENLFWENKDEYQLVYFNFRGKSMEAAYLHDGMLVYTATHLDKETIPGPIKTYLSKNNSRAKLVKAKKVVFEPKYFRKYPTKKQANYFQVVISEKVPKQKQPKISTLFFDPSAHFDMKMDYEVER